MVQVLEVNIPIQIPDNFILIEKDEYKQLKENELLGKTWRMSDVKKLVGRDSIWIRDNILYPYRKQLDIENDGFVYYPKINGDPWEFGALKMSKFLEDNWNSIQKRK